MRRLRPAAERFPISTTRTKVRMFSSNDKSVTLPCAVHSSSGGGCPVPELVPGSSPVYPILPVYLKVLPNAPASRPARTCLPIQSTRHRLGIQPPGTARQREQWRGRDGNHRLGVGQFHAAVAPCHHGDSLDRVVLLFRPSRRQPEEARKVAEGNQRRGVADPRRRLLPHGQV